ncbi:MAG TPA: peptide MFS transporter [Pseudolabrys sp.]|nr:peptide MFS transporter [Pseudolabrys sp.]
MKVDAIFGHPRALGYLFATEMWERFSYYGMRSLLVLYLTKHLLLPDQAGQVLGLAPLRCGMQSLFGALSNQQFASQIYGFYTGLVYLTPVFGGFLADRVLGQRRMVMIGAGLMAVGHFLMAFEPLFLLAITFLIMGNGAFKPNISTQVGALYAPGDKRRDRGFSIFYVGINLGAFLAPLVCGTLGEELGWHYGFLAAGIGMTLALGIYMAARPTLPADPSPLRTPPTRLLATESRQSAILLLLLFVPVSLYWAAYEQQGNTITLWADQFTDRRFLGATIPVTWFQAFNPLMIFAFTPFVVALWHWQGERQPSTMAKITVGCVMNASAYMIMSAAAWTAGPDLASWLWLLGYFIVLTVGEIYLSPTSLSLVTKVAPVSVLSMMMGMWLATSFVGNFLAGYLGTFWSTMEKPQFFLMLAAISGLAGVIIATLRLAFRSVAHD